MKNITVLMLKFSNMYVSYYGNAHSRVNLVSMLKDHVTLLNLLNLCGFRYPFVIFLTCHLTIVKIDDTTNILTSLVFMLIGHVALLIRQIHPVYTSPLILN